MRPRHSNPQPEVGFADLGEFLATQWITDFDGSLTRGMGAESSEVCTEYSVCAESSELGPGYSRRTRSASFDMVPGRTSPADARFTDNLETFLVTVSAFECRQKNQGSGVSARGFSREDLKEESIICLPACLPDEIGCSRGIGKRASIPE